MINRLLIRIKVLQILYNYYHAEGMTPERGLAVLQEALDKSYQLYIYLCGLPLHVSRIARLRIEREQERYTPDTEVIAKLRLMVDNALVKVIAADIEWVERWEKLPFFTPDIDDYILQCLNKWTSSEESETPVPMAPAVKMVDVRDHKNVGGYWKPFFKEYFKRSNDFSTLIEDTSTYLNEDIPIVFSFVEKVFNKYSVAADAATFHSCLKPAYASIEERELGPKLFSLAIEHCEEYRDLISGFFVGWDRSRVSQMDFLILQQAVTERLHFPATATEVVINEYIDMARCYSSADSPAVVNGILHNLFAQLQKEGRL